MVNSLFFVHHGVTSVVHFFTIQFIFSYYSVNGLLFMKYVTIKIYKLHTSGLICSPKVILVRLFSENE
jgi:hypothetical protein